MRRAAAFLPAVLALAGVLVVAIFAPGDLSPWQAFVSVLALGGAALAGLELVIIATWGRRA